MGKVLKLDNGKIADQQDVVDKLERMLELARAGQVNGVMFVTRDLRGAHQCASAGWYGREPKDGLIPALLGVINLCSQAGANG